MGARGCEHDGAVLADAMQIKRSLASSGWRLCWVRVVGGGGSFGFDELQDA